MKFMESGVKVLCMQIGNAGQIFDQGIYIQEKHFNMSRYMETQTMDRKLL